MRNTALLLLALLVTATSLAQIDWDRVERPVTVGVAGYDEPPFIEWPDGPGIGNMTGWIAEMLPSICELAALDCEVVPLPDLAHLIPAVANGTVDFLLHSLSVTETRAELVDFVRPYWYSAGVALYAPEQIDGVLDAAGGWSSLEGEPICLVEGYYAASAVVKEYQIEPVWVSSTRAGIAAVLAGNCTALAWDSGTPASSLEGLAQAAEVAPVRTAPYGIAVMKGEDHLTDRLSAALVRLMGQGNDSLMLQWEKEFVSNAGGLSNPQLGQVVDAISYFQ